MKYILAEEYGIVPSNKKETADKLQELFDGIDRDCTVVLTPGRYYLEHNIKLSGLKNIQIKAYGVTFVTHFNPTVNNDSCKGGLIFNDCEDCNIYGMTFDTDNPTNTVGRITAIDLENNTFDVRIEDGCTMRGDEYIMCLDTCNENLTPNFHIFFCDFNGYRYEKTGYNTFRFYIWHTIAHHLKTASVGELILMKHSLYSGPHLNFTECKRILIEDVTVLFTPGICCGIYPRSEDFTFRRFNVKIPHGSKQICASQTDGIHIKGLVGKLVMEDCHFNNMGDDALNIHNRAGTVFKIEGNMLKLGLRKPENSLDDLPPQLLPINWAQKGDVIYAYDEKTLQKKGKFTVTDFETKDGFNNLYFDNLTCELTPGMKLANSAYYAEVIIKNCSVEGSRARGFLIQSENVTVENCKFYGIASAGLMLACDVDVWNEMGPADNVIIRNNIFEECGINYNNLRADGITIAMDHSNSCARKNDRRDVHHNITIENNKFVNFKDAAIFADAVNGIKITDNEMFNCCTNKENLPEDFRYDVVLLNCDEVTVDNNYNSCGKEISINNKDF